MDPMARISERNSLASHAMSASARAVSTPATKSGDITSIRKPDHASLTGRQISPPKRLRINPRDDENDRCSGAVT